MAAMHGPDSYACAFLWSKKWPTRHVAVPTGNAQASQQSTFRENRLKFSTLLRLLSFVARTRLKSCKSWEMFVWPLKREHFWS